MRNHKIFIDKEWLYQKYYIEYLSTEQIATILNCSAPTVSQRMKEFGLVLRNRSERKVGKLN